MSDARPPAAIDRPAARLVAVAVALAALAMLGWIHRDDLLPGETDASVQSPARAAFLACFTPQDARIAADLDSGRITADQATLFRGRAEAFCTAQAERNGQPAGPSLPAR